MPQASGKITMTPMERWVGFGVLLILVAITFGIYQIQFRFNPAVTARQELPETAAAAEPLSLADLAPDQIQPLSPPEQFNPATLSDG